MNCSVDLEWLRFQNNNYFPRSLIGDQPFNLHELQHHFFFFFWITHPFLGTWDLEDSNHQSELLTLA